MSLPKRDIAASSLKAIWSRADDEAFLQMIWAVNALQDDRVEAARRFLKFPAAATTSDITAHYALHPWELETLVGGLLTTTKRDPGRGKRTDCTEFSTAAAAIQYLRDWENEESVEYLKSKDIFAELASIGYRQFGWQRGYTYAAEFYRYGYIYGQGDCAEYFRVTHGLSIDDFSFSAFALYAALAEGLSVRPSFDAVGISPEIASATLRRIALSGSDARASAAALNRDAVARSGPIPIAYRPSVLRRSPVITFGDGERMRAPLIDLISQRTTAGLYYDFVGAPQEVRNDASFRFERYARRLIEAFIPEITVDGSFRYPTPAGEAETPDLFANIGESTCLVIECKSTKLTYEAQFSDDPLSTGRRGYQDIAKGIFQIWRYISHMRRGLVPARPNCDCLGLVLTLDSWLFLSKALKPGVLRFADELAGRDANILPQDRIPVVLCTVHELESVLSKADAGLLRRCLVSASEPEFDGWQLPGVQEEIGAQLAERKAFPFNVADVLPWWGRVDEARGDGAALRRARNGAVPAE